ncbi:MAG: HD domain-containing protein [Bacteroidales bacterium]|nr:HD domain-containing protein [Bacteroidales bacterium]
MNLSGSVYNAEKKYLNLLENFFVRTWGETMLWSHGIEHHRRVWQFARELLATVSDSKTPNPQISPDNLIVACYLHDLGMAADPGPNHGVLSYQLCKKFLAENKLSESQFDETLSAIENHDNKEFPYSSSQNQILKMLTAADDLDAFGFIGIYRYSEIYLARGILPERIGYMIRENAGFRYKNFRAAFGSYQTLITKHAERYFILDDFFSAYNNQVPGYRFVNQNPSGYCGVIEYFNETGIEKDSVQRLVTGPFLKTSDHTINWYFNGFLKELHPRSQP